MQIKGHVSYDSSRVPETASHTATRHRLCPACGRDNADRRALPESHRQWELKACGQCGFVYLEDAPAYEELEEHFAWEKTYQEERARRAREEPVFHWVSRRLIDLRGRLRGRPRLITLTEQLVPPGEVLDVGCADGRQLADLDSRYVPHGIEVSRALAARATAVVEPRGGTIVQANALEGLAQFPAGRFAGVWMHSFLEHELEPLAALRAAGRVLRPDGRLILKMPNYASLNRRVRGARWCGFRFPDHVNYFTPASLRTMVEAAGLEVTRMNFTDRLPTSDNMWLVACRPSRSGAL